jgi:hypothetical protein
VRCSNIRVLSITLATIVNLAFGTVTYAQCTTTPIKCGESKFGTLSSNTCTFTGGGGVYSSYNFTAIAGQHVDIFLESSTFRPQLALYGPNSSLPIAVDDSPGSTLSYISYLVSTAGTYRIAAGGYGFGQTSGTFSLSLYCQNGCVAPVIREQPTPRTIGPGESATLTVRADGTAPLHYAWRDIADPLTSIANDSATLNTGPLFSTKRYQVTVSNSCGGSTDSAPVEVKVTCDRPVITSQPSSITASAPLGSVSLSVSAIGSAPLSYEWFYGLPGDTSRLAGTGATLSLQSVSTTTLLWARVTNACGVATSASASITITATPRTRRRPVGH